MTKCENCKNRQPNELITGPDNKLYCPDCFDIVFFCCNNCNKLKRQDTDLDLTDFADGGGSLMVCKKCVKKNTKKTRKEK
jgi:hypothetical protein